MTRAEQIIAVEFCIDVAEQTAHKYGRHKQKIEVARVFLQELEAEADPVVYDGFGECITDAEQDALFQHCSGTPNYRVVRKLYRAAHPREPETLKASEIDPDNAAAWILKYGNSRTKKLNGRYVLSWYMDEIPLEGDDVPLIGIPLFTHAPVPTATIPEGWQDIARQALKEIREVWAGAECGEPVTAQEGYAIHLCKQMYQIAVEALAAAPPAPTDTRGGSDE